MDLQLNTYNWLNQFFMKTTGNTSDASSNLWTNIQICEKMLSSLGSKDSHNISFFDKNASPLSPALFIELLQWETL